MKFLILIVTLAVAASAKLSEEGENQLFADYLVEYRKVKQLK